MSDLPLATEFPAATRAQWLKLVAGVLKGAEVETLVAHTYDGIRVEPLYEKADRPPQLLRTNGRWRIAQRVDHPDPAAANELALADLEGGADALTLVFSEAAGARGFGLTARTADALDRALRGVQLDLVHLRLDAGHAGVEAVALLTDLAARRGHALAALDLDLGLDAIGAAAASGRLPEAWERGAAETLSRLAGRGFRGRAFLADGRPYHEAGAGEAQELAAVLATAVAYLRALEAGGHDLAAARDTLAFLLVADADEFLTIAKFRALRRLWERIEEACGLDPKPIRLHAETAWRMTTRRDPWVNLLRTTVAAFSAGVAGADTVTILPFTAALGLPDAFARRMARNTQLILMEEAHVWRVADPAAGAGGFEALTDGLCEHAWSDFQKIEREDGIVASLAAGAIQARIAAVRGARERAVATRHDAITGTSEFPDIKEAPVDVLLPSPLRGEPAPDLIRGVGGGGRDERPQFENEHHAWTSGDPVAVHSDPAHQAEPPLPPTLPRKGQEGRFTPLRSIRLAEPYERLRDLSDAHLAHTGARPKVFLANLGPPAAFTARATFAKNFFETGGIEAIATDGFSSPEAVAEAFAASGARLACLCSADEIYTRYAASVTRALRRAGAREVYLAGQPDGLPGDAAEAVGAFIFARCDALALLTEAMAKAAT